MDKSPLYALSQTTVSMLRKNATFFRNYSERIRKGEKLEGASKKELDKLQELRLTILTSVKYFCDSYLNETIPTPYEFILMIAKQILEDDVCCSDYAIESVHLLLTTTMPKLVCEKGIELELINILDRLQNVVHHSSIYSSPVKTKVEELMLMAKHRFCLDLKVFKVPIEPLIRNHDLKLLRQQHQLAVLQQKKK